MSNPAPVAWRVDWIPTYGDEPMLEFFDDILDAMLSQEMLANAKPPMESTLTPLYEWEKP